MPYDPTGVLAVAARIKQLERAVLVSWQAYGYFADSCQVCEKDWSGSGSLPVHMDDCIVPALLEKHADDD